MFLQHDNKCAVCREVIVKKLGPSPEGSMNVEYLHGSLPGHRYVGTIVIRYNIPDGIQGVSFAVLYK